MKDHLLKQVTAALATVMLLSAPSLASAQGCPVDQPVAQAAIRVSADEQVIHDVIERYRTTVETLDR